MIGKCCRWVSQPRVVDGDVRNAALDQAPRGQAGLSEGVAAVPVAQGVLLLGKIEHLARVAQDQLVGLLFSLVHGLQRGVALEGLFERVQVVQELAAGLLALVGDALSDHALHGEAGLLRIAAGGEGRVTRSQEARLGEAAQRLGEHDVGRDQAAIPGVEALEQRVPRRRRRDTRVRSPGFLPGLHHVSRRFMGVDAVRQAADDGVLVGLFGQQGQQFSDDDAIHVGGDGFIERAAVVVPGGGLGIERIQVRRAAPHPDLDHRLGFGLGRGLSPRAFQARDGGAAPNKARRKASRLWIRSTCISIISLSA